jgi:predicted ribonuclease toxin of YeeF-YezG toxin-antitoxin module
VSKHTGAKMGLPKTRAEAKETGATHYFTGKPCKHGHLAPRVLKGTCVECRKVEWVKENERRKQLPKSEAAKAAGRRYYEKNKPLVIARAVTRPVEAKRAYRKKYDEANKKRRNLRNLLRKKRHRIATPQWLTPEHKERIRQVYLQAQHMSELTGEKYVVDHIVPLKNKHVCGLHVPWNLRIMTHAKNCKKHNKFSV